MILSFNIEYRTNWGEEVRIAGLSPESVPLHTTDGIYWTAELEFEVPNEGLTIHYNYQIEQNGIVTRKEWDSFSRCLFLSGTSKKKYRINDCRLKLLIARPLFQICPQPEDPLHHTLPGV